MFSIFKAPRQSTRTSIGLLAIRLVVGLAFIYHGYGKIQNPTNWMPAVAGVPGYLQACAAISEFGGGIAWMAGLLTPLFSLGLICTMFEAARFHIGLNQPFVDPKGGGSYELAAVYLSVAILLLFAGPGRFSADRFVFGEKG